MPKSTEQTVTLPVSIIEDLARGALVMKEVMDNHIEVLTGEDHERMSYASKLITDANKRIQEEYNKAKK